MIRKSIALGALVVPLCLLTSCGVGTEAGSDTTIKSARSLSAHYVLVTFEGKAGLSAADPSAYRVVAPDDSQLEVLAVEMDADQSTAVLATSTQDEVEYLVGLGDAETLLAGRSVPVGAVGFRGTSEREPFLESAVSLSSTEILLTFSHQMDRESAETVAFYEIADPDGNTDIDIRLTAAALQPDLMTVILSTTPQENLEYQIRATNVKRRFSCEDGGRVFLDSATQGTTCAGNFRPVDSDDNDARYVLTARTKVDVADRLNPDATGDGASIGLDAFGAGVRRPLCNGGGAEINGGNGSDPDEEIIITADSDELAENVVLGLRELQFGVDEPVLFLSSDASPGFDIVIDTAAIFGAINTGLTSGDLVFANLPSIAPGLRIDAIKLRETNDGIYLNSICGLATNRRLIDPTRNTARFFGNPPVDNVAPRLVSAESISDTEVILSFSEPLSSEAADPSNFQISPDLTVIGAELGRYDTQVILTTSPQRVDVVYTVVVSNITDKAANPIDPAANSATFSFAGGPAGLGADALPRVVGAASTGNTGVIVVFSKPMGPSAEVAGNYIIVQTEVNPEVGALGILAANFVNGQQDAVELTTTSQNEASYQLQVINVRDLSGNQLAPPQLLVDPSRADFAGTPFSCGDAVCDPPDADGDTIPDFAELRGYVVTVELSGGDTIEREVSSDPNSPDTDGDGLGDEVERRIASDPRRPDTDEDQLTDFVEFTAIKSSPTDQDSDDDGLGDLPEVTFFKTNALLADSDGDGFDDRAEVFEMNRDPRIADLPTPRLSISSVNLLIEEQFSFSDELGREQTEESSTSTTLESSAETKTTNQVGFNLGVKVEGEFEGGLDNGLIDALGKVTAGAELGFAFQHTSESARSTMSSLEASLSKGLSVTGSSSTTREVVGGRVDALVSIGNLSDVAFSIENLELTVSAPNPVDRTSFVPVATLVPNSTLVTGDPAKYNIGVLDDAGRGPILFTSRDVFPTLVEDLMRDPRGLIFEFANYDLTDEFERNFAYTSQTARDRTVGLVIDSGDGNPERYFVAYAPVQFDSSTCDTAANPGCDIVGGLNGFADGGIPPFGGLGKLPGLPLEYILEEVLQLRRSEPVVTPIWMQQPFTIPEMTGAGAVAPDGILVGENGVSDSIAQGDDVQLIPFGIDGLPQDALVISAGENGILETNVRPDDVPAVVTGYATSRTCGPTTPSTIRPGPNGVVETIRDPLSDDRQLQDFGSPSHAVDVDIIGPGANGFIDTAPAGDDVYVGPGIPCDDDADCPGAGVCDGQEILYRLDRRSRGQFGRIWAVLVPEDSLIGLDFRKVVLRPGQVLNLGFVQDLDRDGLISDVENLFGSSDTRQDTDGDGLDDFSEVRVGWEIGVEGESIRRVFPDPRLRDTDGDGLNDREEQDFRRVQCECDGAAIMEDRGKACTRAGLPDFCSGGANDGRDCASNAECPGGVCTPRKDTLDLCRGGSCVNVADQDLSSALCSSDLSRSRLDPRRRDTDSDRVTDADEVLGWLTRAAVIEPKNVVVAGDRRADTVACPGRVCQGGSNDGNPCLFDRDCPTLKVCTKGINQGAACVNDIDCVGQTPALSGLCEEADAVDNPPAGSPPTPFTGVCDRSDACDDVQVVAPGMDGLDPQTVVVAPGKDGSLHPSTLASASGVGESSVASGDNVASTTAAGDDQQVAAVDPTEPLEDSVLGRTIVRPGINGTLDTLQPEGDDVVALGQFIQTTDPLRADTDQDQVGDGFERVLGSDPRDPTDGGLLADSDGDGLTDQQEQLIGWNVTVLAAGASAETTYRVFSNPNVADSDLDGLPDLAESRLRTDPRNPDTDGDRLSDFDEVTAEQLADFADLEDLFIGFVIDGESSQVYGTSAIDCDTDDDRLSDDFEVLEGFDVSLRAEDGVLVFRAYTDPTNPDTDFDGLGDGAEYSHTVECVDASDCEAAGRISACVCPDGSNSCLQRICAATFPTDPTGFDSDGDGKADGTECLPIANVAATDCGDLCGVCTGASVCDGGPNDGAACNQNVQCCAALAACTSNPLIPDKRVTIRYVELLINEADEDGAGGRSDIKWEFGAHRSDEPFPGAIWAPPLSTTVPDCEPTGLYENCSGGECGLKIGDSVIFGSDTLGLCKPGSVSCPTLPAPWKAPVCLGSGACQLCFPNPFNDVPPFPTLPDICFVLPALGDGEPDNERTFTLRPGEGLLLWGEVREFDNCEGSKCAGGPRAGADCTQNPAACCANVPGTCPEIDGQDVCVGGLKEGQPCAADADCSQDDCGVCQATGESANRVAYFKSLSYESVREGFTTDIATLNDTSSDSVQFSVTIVVEIIVE